MSALLRFTYSRCRSAAGIRRGNTFAFIFERELFALDWHAEIRRDLMTFLSPETTTKHNFLLKSHLGLELGKPLG